MTPTRKLRPGLLVSLKTSIRGNVRYNRLTIEAAHRTLEGEQKEAWQTEKTIADPAEHESAVKVRGKCRSLITGVCAQSDFGLLCLQSRRADLDSALAESRKLAAEFNRTSALTSIEVNYIVGEIAADEVEAVKAINSEMRSLVADMESGIQSLDVAKIRDAANKARDVSQMLEPEAAEKIQAAIAAARSVARKIVKAGEQAAQEVDRQTLATLAAARSAFLDMESGTVSEPAAEASAIDIAPAATVTESFELGPVDVEFYKAFARPPSGGVDID